MIRKRFAHQRGHADHGWLQTYHTFSFASYHDPEYMGFRALRVINDDIIQPGKGFGTHGHRDMEIITYVLNGALEHRDSMGTGSVLRPGDVQRMSAGRGVTHSEFNHSPDEALRLLQIWIVPERKGIEPGYEEKSFAAEEKRGKLHLIVAPDGAGGALSIHQDVRLYATLLDAGTVVEQGLEPARHAWVQVAKGHLVLNGTELAEGDGAAVSEESLLRLEGREAAEVLVFDLS
jgi:redox-sensitive bicupin YhaK (pirin superfamily)